MSFRFTELAVRQNAEAVHLTVHDLVLRSVPAIHGVQVSGIHTVLTMYKTILYIDRTDVKNTYAKLANGKVRGKAGNFAALMQIRC